MSKKLGSPLPDSKVVNREPSVLLIGYGWVGQYMGKYFTQAHYVGSDGVIRFQDGTEVPTRNSYELGIVSVPTPMDKKTGRCDVTLVENVVYKYKSFVNTFLIKSTVEPGTTDRLASAYQVKVCMSPEYIGETLGHPLLEPKRDAFLIIGGEDDVAYEVAEYFRLVLHAYAPILIVSAIEAEIIKYAENMWIMQRVDYWNDVYEVCKTFGANYYRVREGVVLDPRMGRTHSFVYANNRGFGGKCIPKDMNALAYAMRKAKNPLKTIEFQIDKNVTKWRKDDPDKDRLIPEKPLWHDSQS